MMRQSLAILALAALIAPAAAQDACIPISGDDGSTTYEAPSSGHVVTIAPHYESLIISHDGDEQSCRMSFEDRSKVGLGDTWFPANTVTCKKFTAQLSFVTPREGGEMMMIFDGMTFYPKCAE